MHDGQTQGRRTQTQGVSPHHAAALATVGFALFDFGQLFARPLRGESAGALDVTLSICQALACLIALAAAIIAEKRHATNGTSGSSSVQERTAQLAAFGATAACAVGMLVVFTAPASPGLVSAYIGAGLLGAGFGFGYTAWLLMFCRLARSFKTASTSPSIAHVAALPVVSLLASRAAALVVRLVTGETAWNILGLVCLTASLIALLALLRQTTSANATTVATLPSLSGSDQHPLRRSLPALLGAGLFSLLFGLMTQIHNSLGAWSPVPDYLSSLITVIALLVLAICVAGSHHRLSIENVFLVTLPLIAAVMVAVPLLWAQVSDIADALVKSFFSFYLAALFVYVIQTNADTSGPDSEVLPTLAMAVVWTGTAVGSTVGLTFVRLTSGVALVSVFLVATWACMLAAVIYARTKAQTNPVDTSGSSGIDATVATTPAASQSTVVYIDIDDERVRRLGAEYGLSDREQDVVRLLVKGRSAARIANELFLSENTVKTHMQNVYSKLGIHTKQELLDKVSSIEILETPADERKDNNGEDASPHRP